MSNLAHRQSIIQEKRKKTPWRQFVMDIASWYPLNFYKNGGMISKYAIGSKRVVNVVDSIEYEKIRNNSINKEFVFEYNGNLFAQIQKLIFELPQESLKIFQNCENSSFTDIAFAAKNSYLSSCVLESQNVLYSVLVKGGSINIYNSLLVYDNCSNIYYSRSVVKSSNIFYSSYIQNCGNIWFSTNLIGCNYCFNCNELENKSYCINNFQYEKEEYLLLLTDLLKDKNQFSSLHSKTFLAQGMNTGGLITGFANLSCNNLTNGYFNYGVENSNNTCFSGNGVLMQNIYDAFSAGCGESHYLYGVMGVGFNASHIYCCVETAVNVYSCFYCYYLESCSFCLGCIGLKNKSYCVLNKQYTKEERYEKVDEIFGQMHEDGTLGEFFPATMNPFYFNDTAAYLIDHTFTKEEVTAAGYLRRDEPIKVDIPAGVQTVSVKDLDKYEGWKDGKRHIDDEILKKVILDDQGNAYRIIPMELEFLRKYELPLPRKHWLDRMKENFRIS